MKQYDSYKDSGVEWIGEVPSHWNVSKILFCLQMPITDGPHTTPQLFDEGVPFVSAEAVSFGNGGIDFEHIRGFVSEEFYKECCKKYIPHKNDVYMIKSGATTGKVSIVDTDKKFTIWSPLAVFRANRSIILPYYIYYFLVSDAFQRQVEFNWSYGTQQNIGMRTLEKLMISYPLIEEQKKIVSFLDKKCSEIDNVISAQQKRIALLQELKQSVITHAVTKGLNPNVEMKDSGVEWIGEIPASWNVIPLKRFGTMNKGLTFTKADIVEKGNPAISYGQVHSKTNDGVCLQNELIRFVPDIFIANAEKSIAHQGDFIFADTSEDYDGCGNCVYNDTPQLIFGGYHTVVLQTKDTDAKFMAYLFRTDYWRYQIRSRVYGVKVYSITQSILSLCSVLLPPKEEQRDIVSYLDKRCASIDSSVSKAQHQVELLQEYKQSLITEVVTGKRKIC